MSGREWIDLVKVALVVLLLAAVGNGLFSRSEAPEKYPAALAPPQSPRPAVLPPPPAAPEPPPPPPWRLTLDHYRKVKAGMSYDEVAKIVGRHGTEVGETEIAAIPGVSPRTTIWMAEWANSDYSTIHLTFQNGEVTSKVRVGLR